MVFETMICRELLMELNVSHFVRLEMLALDSSQKAGLVKKKMLDRVRLRQDLCRYLSE